MGVPLRRAVDPFLGGAFTLLEVLVALLFLAILLPVLSEALLRANRASVYAERSALAVALAENKLAELLYDNDWALKAAAEGEFPETPGFRWKQAHQTWEMDNMTRLTVEVFYPLQGEERSVRLDTLVLTSTETVSSSP